MLCFCLHDPSLIFSLSISLSLSLSLSLAAAAAAAALSVPHLPYPVFVPIFVSRIKSYYEVMFKDTHRVPYAAFCRKSLAIFTGKAGWFSDEVLF